MDLALWSLPAAFWKTQQIDLVHILSNFYLSISSFGEITTWGEGRCLAHWATRCPRVRAVLTLPNSCAFSFSCRMAPAGTSSTVLSDGRGGDSLASSWVSEGKVQSFIMSCTDGHKFLVDVLYNTEVFPPLLQISWEFSFLIVSGDWMLPHAFSVSTDITMFFFFSFFGLLISFLTLNLWSWANPTWGFFLYAGFDLLIVCGEFLHLNSWTIWVLCCAVFGFDNQVVVVSKICWENVSSFVFQKNLRKVSVNSLNFDRILQWKHLDLEIYLLVMNLIA